MLELEPFVRYGGDVRLDGVLHSDVSCGAEVGQPLESGLIPSSGVVVCDGFAFSVSREGTL